MEIPQINQAGGRRRAVAADGRPAVLHVAHLLLHLMPSPSCLPLHPQARSQSRKYTELCTCAWV